MKYQMLASSGKLASQLGFGAWQLGNEAFWSKMSHAEGVALVRKAVDEGVTFFDTAPGYAAGVSELILGEALKDVREKVIISSKFGHNIDGTVDFSIEAIEPSILRSCERLQTTYLDCLLLHNPDSDILSGKTDHFKVLKELKAKGLIKSFGVSIDSLDEFKIALTKTNAEVIEILFNAFFQAPIQYLAFAKAKKISLIAKVPLDSGWLTGKFDENSVFTGIRERWTKDTIKRRSVLVKQLQTLVKEKELTKYALGFIYSFDVFTSVIPGVSSLEQLAKNLEYTEYELPYNIKQSMIELYNFQVKNKPLPW